MQSWDIVITLFSALILCSTASAQGASLASRSWSTSVSGSIAQVPPANAEIQAFVSGQLNQDGLQDVNVCSSAFIDLTGTGQYNLVASVDQSGRYFCNEVAVFSKTQSGIQAQETEAWNANDVAQLIQRLDQSGGKLLVIPQAYSVYQGAKCLATVDKIYSLQNGTLTDVSASHTAYFKQQLASLNSQIAAAPATADRSCKQMEADKLQRMLALAPDAGLAQAISWSKSGDRDLRSKSVTVLADIGSKAALAQLRTMVGDQDSGVALQAKQSLGQK